MISFSDFEFIISVDNIQYLTLFKAGSKGYRSKSVQTEFIFKNLTFMFSVFEILKNEMC